MDLIFREQDPWFTECLLHSGHFYQFVIHPFRCSWEGFLICPADGKLKFNRSIWKIHERSACPACQGRSFLCASAAVCLRTAGGFLCCGSRMAAAQGKCAGMENSLLSKEQAVFLSWVIVFFLRYCVDLDEEIIEALKYKKWGVAPPPNIWGYFKGQRGASRML